MFSDNFFKFIITIFLVVSFLLLPRVGFNPEGGEGFDTYRNIMFPLSHANIFHLACNLICLWQIKHISTYILPAIVISFLSSLMPSFYCHDIMGVSGVLFAIIGLKYGRFSTLKAMVRNTAFFFIITAFIPNVAALFHIYCITIAFIVGWLYKNQSLWKK